MSIKTPEIAGFLCFLALVFDLENLAKNAIIIQ